MYYQGSVFGIEDEAFVLTAPGLAIDFLFKHYLALSEKNKIRM